MQSDLLQKKGYWTAVTSVIKVFEQLQLLAEILAKGLMNVFPGRVYRWNMYGRQLIDVSL
jgi:hypothetical protein